MDKEFDEALKNLAGQQLKEGVVRILLAIVQPSGDVVISVPRSGSGDFILYARVSGATKEMARLRQ